MRSWCAPPFFYGRCPVKQGKNGGDPQGDHVSVTVDRPHRQTVHGESRKDQSRQSKAKDGNTVPFGVDTYQQILLDQGKHGKSEGVENA